MCNARARVVRMCVHELDNSLVLRYVCAWCCSFLQHCIVCLRGVVASCSTVLTYQAFIFVCAST